MQQIIRSKRKPLEKKNIREFNVKIFFKAIHNKKKIKRIF